MAGAVWVETVLLESAAVAASCLQVFREGQRHRALVSDDALPPAWTEVGVALRTASSLTASVTVQ